MKRKIQFALLATAILLLSCKTSNQNNSDQEGFIRKENFDTILDGKNVGLYTLSNSGGMKVFISNYGARIVSLVVPGKNRQMVDVVLGFSSISDYLKSPDPYFGPCVGRVGNRIAKGKFTLEGTDYSLEVNNGPNHLHGGLKGLHNRVWDIVSATDSSLVLHYLSPDMEEGYPGNLDITITYSLSANNSFIMDYTATTNKITPVNLTNHSYFNLSGVSSYTINNHFLTLNAENYTPVDSTLIPLGTIEPVAGTPFDFTIPKTIGTDLEVANDQLTYGAGYDHNFALNSTDSVSLQFAARVFSPESGVEMEIYTSEPGIQFYGGNFFTGAITGKDGSKIGFRCGFALEPQHFPDSPNQPAFESINLLPGETYHSVSKYVFGVIKE